MPVTVSLKVVASFALTERRRRQPGRDVRPPRPYQGTGYQGTGEIRRLITGGGLIRRPGPRPSRPRT
ncbi:MAG TPA: hypothetical protein VHF26_17280 [Trebonia sp.]|nr:hypothetical protein [Trebonia sp.]